jgi:hypothetical protein
MSTKPRLVSEVLPDLAKELETLLLNVGEANLAAQIPSLRIVDRCRCGDDFCATFYVLPRPKEGYVDLDSEKGMLILDIVAEQIAAIEVLYRDEVRKVIDDPFS